MFDFAWSEIAVIAMVALVVIGPKELPKALRTLGFWVGRARSIAREFQSSLDQMIREAELEEVRKQVETVTELDVAQTIEKTVDPGGELKHSLAEPLVSDAIPPPAQPTAGSIEEAAATREEPAAAEPAKSATHG